MRMVYGNKVAQWVAEQTSGCWTERSQSIGLERDGCLTAGVVYEDWNGRSIVAHLAICGRASREFFACVADYAFRQCGVAKVVAPVASTNQRMMRMAPKMGFVEEARLKDTQPDGDTVLFTLTAKRCPFLGEKYGKRRSSPAHA